MSVTEEVFDEHFQPGVYLYEIKAEAGSGKREAECRYAGTAECCGCPHCRLKTKDKAFTAEPQRTQSDMEKGQCGELTKEEAALQMEGAGSCKELFEWLIKNQARFGAEKKEILGYFNARMGKLKVIETDRFHNRRRRTHGGNV